MDNHQHDSPITTVPPSGSPPSPQSPTSSPSQAVCWAMHAAAAATSITLGLPVAKAFVVLLTAPTLEWTRLGIAAAAFAFAVAPASAVPLIGRIADRFLGAPK